MGKCPEITCEKKLKISFFQTSGNQSLKQAVLYTNGAVKPLNIIIILL